MPFLIVNKKSCFKGSLYYILIDPGSVCWLSIHQPNISSNNHSPLSLVNQEKNVSDNFFHYSSKASLIKANTDETTESTSKPIPLK